MPWPERILVDPEILAGKPVIRGTRIAVEFILELPAAGQAVEALRKQGHDVLWARTDSWSEGSSPDRAG